MNCARPRSRTTSRLQFRIEVYADAGLSPVAEDKITVRAPGSDAPVTVFLSESAPIPSPSWTLHGEVGRRTMLRRLWAG